MKNKKSGFLNGLTAIIIYFFAMAKDAPYHIYVKLQGKSRHFKDGTPKPSGSGGIFVPVLGKTRKPGIKRWQRPKYRVSGIAC